MTSNPHAWLLSELREKPTNGLRVVSTFACGGGSSMGYKRAGYEVVCANDIDPEMAWHYQRNLKPPNYVLAPIRELIARWPDGLSRDVDVLDGSPPCSTFSLAGLRERNWGKKKHFREGQAEQVLDDLFFDFLDVVGAIRPRVVVAENVAGLIYGQAKGYVRLIFQRLRDLGYAPQIFRVNAAYCGVPQTRERVFVCARRLDLGRPDLTISSQTRIVSAAEACCDLVVTDEERRETAPCPTHRIWWPRTHQGEIYSQAVKRHGCPEKLFSWRRLHPNRPSPTLLATHMQYAHWGECRSLTYRESLRLGSFPDDYIAKTDKLGKYLIGMSVPPKMMEVVAAAVRDQWLS